MQVANHSILPIAGFGLLLAASLNLSAQPVPHHFRGLTISPDRTVTLALEGSLGNSFNLTGTPSNQFRQIFDLYPIEASADLTDWTRLALLPRPNNDPNPLLFQDTNAAGSSRRFYRTFTNHLITAFPKPTGPFAVGTFSVVLTDSSRSNRYGLKTNSSFMCTLWYPAEPARSGTMPRPYNDQAVATDRAFYSFWGLSTQWTSAVPQFVAHSVPGLPMLAGTNRFPVILHSHGWTCDRRLNSQNAEELASHGYIVAAVDHEDCHATIYPDVRGARYVTPGSLSGAGLATSRVKDLQCLQNELARMDASDPLLQRRFDLDRIGVTGFSVGGGTAAEFCRQETKVKCAALLDAFILLNYYPELNQSGLQKPFLAMNRTVLDHSDRLWDASSDSGHIYNLAAHDAIWLKVSNTGHFAFCDWSWSVDATESSRPGAVAINACLVWFFDTYLKGEAPPLPTNPELTNVQRK